MEEERDEALTSNAELSADKAERESISETSSRLLQSMEANVSLVRSEREELKRQHETDKETLRGIFNQLEAQVAIAREERSELQSRGDRERRAAARRIRELEEALNEALHSKERMRDACEREKEGLTKQFEQRLAGLRLEKEQARLDKALLRRLEKELTELKSLSTTVLGPLAAPMATRLPQPEPIGYEDASRIIEAMDDRGGGRRFGV